MLTSLDVVNQCLASMALAPITEGEITNNAYAQSALTSLNKFTTDTLTKGWWFNERLITVDPLPANLLRVEGNFGRLLSWRGAALGIYDHTRGAYLTTPYPAKTLGYVSLPFADLPPALQAYIAALTVVAFQADFDGGETKAKQLAGEVARTLALVQEIDRNSRFNYKRFWELMSQSWWFNTFDWVAEAGVTPALPALPIVRLDGPPDRPLFLSETGVVCATLTGNPISEDVPRARATVQIPPDVLPPAASEWLRKASALDAERESLNADPRVLADLNDEVDRCFAALRREHSERVVLRDQSREFQARGWWFNEFTLTDVAAMGSTVEGGASRPVPPADDPGGGVGSDTVALFHFDGADNSTTFTDAAGNAVIGGTTHWRVRATQQRFGTGSLRKDGVNSPPTGLTITPEFYLHRDFTFECWVRYDAQGQGILFTANGPTFGSFVQVGLNIGDTAVGGEVGGVYADFPTPIITTGWHHIAACRAGSVCRYFVDGVLMGTSTGLGGDPDELAEFVYVAGQDIGGGGWSAFLDEWHLRQGAFYVADFTPPDAPFPDPTPAGPPPPAPAVPPPTMNVRVTDSALRARGPAGDPVSLRYNNSVLGVWSPKLRTYLNLNEAQDDVTVWLELPFEELPSKAQEYVRIRSRITLAREHGSSPTYMSQLQNEAARLLRELHHEQTSTVRANVGNRPSLQRKLHAIRTGGLYYNGVSIR